MRHPAVWNHAAPCGAHVEPRSATQCPRITTQARKMDIRAIALSFREEKQKGERKKTGRINSGKDKQGEGQTGEKDKRAGRSSNSRALDRFNYCQIGLF
jgi:hypothetical protein